MTGVVVNAAPASTLGLLDIPSHLHAQTQSVTCSYLPTRVPSVEVNIQEFPKITGFVWCPCMRDPIILGPSSVPLILESPI